ncbi:hypothetical protein AB1L05_08895 [Cytobacillus horneckiae]|uniref:hypothetical protein n=1 Tax=Cytobacillus horneckiae TaxID=549687 RepID=UPI0039A0E2BB
MKKALISLTFIFISIALVACNNNEEPVVKDDDQKETEIDKTKKAEEENDSKVPEKETNEIKAPTERTEQIDGYPWEVYEPYGNEKAIQERVQNGEVVYLFSDADALENEILKSIENADGKKDWWHFNLMYFNINLKDFYPEKKAYFDKMKEVEEALFSSNLDIVPNLINEAKKLRAE